jgi:hypothetical protein
MHNPIKSICLIMTAIISVAIFNEPAYADPTTLILRKKKPKPPPPPKRTPPARTAHATRPAPTPKRGPKRVEQINLPSEHVETSAQADTATVAPEIITGAVIGQPVANGSPGALTMTNTGLGNAVAATPTPTLPSPAAAAAATIAQAQAVAAAFPSSIASFGSVPNTAGGGVISVQTVPNFSAAIVPNLVPSTLQPNIFNPNLSSQVVSIVQVNGQQTVSVSNPPPLVNSQIFPSTAVLPVPNSAVSIAPSLFGSDTISGSFGSFSPGTTGGNMFSTTGTNFSTVNGAVVPNTSSQPVSIGVPNAIGGSGATATATATANTTGF